MGAGRSGSSTMNNIWVKLGISGVAAILIAVRMYWPAVKIDAITIGLFVVALIPWLTSIVESFKAPGGWEIKLRDVSEAGRKITDAAPDAAPTVTSDEAHSFLAVAEQYPNLALVGLRIEIEKRLRRLAQSVSADISMRQGPSMLLRELEKREILNQSVLGGLREIIMAGNRAAHGATVEPALADWAFSNGSAVLSALDNILEARGSS